MLGHSPTMQRRSIFNYSRLCPTNARFANFLQSLDTNSEGFILMSDVGWVLVVVGSLCGTKQEAAEEVPEPAEEVSDVVVQVDGFRIPK